MIDEVSDVRRKAAKRLVRFTHHYSLYGVQSYLLHSLPHDDHTFLELVMRHRHVLCSMPYQCCWAQIYWKGYYFVVLSSKLDVKRQMGDLCNQYYDYYCRVLSS